GKPNHRYDQSVFDGYSHADVYMMIDPDGLSTPDAVDGRMLLQRQRHRFQHEIVKGDLDRRNFVEPGPGLYGAVHVDRHRYIEVWRGELALGKSSGDGLAHLRYRYLLEAFLARRYS